MRLNRLRSRYGVLAACALIASSALATGITGVVPTGASGIAIGTLERPASATASSSPGAVAVSDPGPNLDVGRRPAVVPSPAATHQPAPAPAQALALRQPPRATPPRPTSHGATKRTPSAGQVALFGTSGTETQFLALMKNMSIDTIEMAPGTYHNWHLDFNVDRTARPLTIKPAHGTVIFDASGSSSREGPFLAGWGGYTAYVRFQGPFVIQNYTIGQTGLVATDWVNHLTFNGFTVRGTKAPSTNGQTAWAVYISSDGTHHGSNLTFDDWNVDNSTSDHKVSGLQLYHTPQAAGVTALRWRVTGGYWGFVGRGNATGVKIESWTITNCTVSVDSNGPAGIVENVHAKSSGAPTIRKPMIDGGGNSWS